MRGAMSAFWLVGLIAGLDAAAAPPGAPDTSHAEGPRGEFLGWQPDSTRFAYRLYEGRRDTYFLKKIMPGGVARAERYNGSVRDLIKRKGFLTTTLEGQRLSHTVQAFIVAPGKTLRVVLEVGRRRLSYSMWLDDVTKPGAPTRLRKGYFKEVWSDFVASAYPSPDGKWVAVVLQMSTPWAMDTWVEGVRVSDAK